MSRTTDAQRIRAVDAAYDYAIAELVRADDLVDSNQIAGVAASYALSCWEDWLGSGGMIDLSIARDKLQQIRHQADDQTPSPMFDLEA